MKKAQRKIANHQFQIFNFGTRRFSRNLKQKNGLTKSLLLPQSLVLSLLHDLLDLLVLELDLAVGLGQVSVPSIIKVFRY